MYWMNGWRILFFFSFFFKSKSAADKPVRRKALNISVCIFRHSDEYDESTCSRHALLLQIAQDTKENEEQLDRTVLISCLTHPLLLILCSPGECASLHPASDSMCLDDKSACENPTTTPPKKKLTLASEHQNMLKCVLYSLFGADYLAAPSRGGGKKIDLQPNSLLFTSWEEAIQYLDNDRWSGDTDDDNPHNQEEERQRLGAEVSQTRSDFFHPTTHGLMRWKQ